LPRKEKGKVYHLKTHQSPEFEKKNEAIKYGGRRNPKTIRGWGKKLSGT
jgi:hypothetical protein